MNEKGEMKNGMGRTGGSGKNMASSGTGQSRVQRGMDKETAAVRAKHDKHPFKAGQSHRC